MFSPMLVYQTFEDSTLIDYSTSSIFNSSRAVTIHRKFQSYASIQSLQKWAKDPITHQPVRVCLFVLFVLFLSVFDYDESIVIFLVVVTCLCGAIATIRSEWSRFNFRTTYDDLRIRSLSFRLFSNFWLEESILNDFGIINRIYSICTDVNMVVNELEIK